MLRYLKCLLPSSVIVDVIAHDEVVGCLWEINASSDYCIVFNEENSWQR